MSSSMIQEAIKEFQASHNKHTAAANFAPSEVSAEHAESVWNQVVNGLRAKGIPWVQILSLLGPILQMIFAGNPLAAIIAQILALLNPPTPTPA